MARKNQTYQLPELDGLSTEDLRSVVRRAAKVANQRLRELEKREYTRGVYRTAQADLGDSRRRYKENVKSMNLNQLRHEYKILRSFLSAKTSTLSGRSDVEKKRFETAQERGFSGTADEFADLVEKFFTAENERLFSSDIIYSTLTSKDNRDLIDIVLSQAEDGDSQADVLKKYLKEYSKRKRRKRKK